MAVFDSCYWWNLWLLAVIYQAMEGKGRSGFPDLTLRFQFALQTRHGSGQHIQETTLRWRSESVLAIVTGLGYSPCLSPGDITAPSLGAHAVLNRDCLRYNPGTLLLCLRLFVADMLLLVSRDRSGRSFRGDMRWSLKRDCRIIRPILIGPLASGLAPFSRFS
jgi:hypothetical protein